MMELLANSPFLFAALLMGPLDDISTAPRMIDKSQITYLLIIDLLLHIRPASAHFVQLVKMYWGFLHICGLCKCGEKVNGTRNIHNAR
ncbi:hypothetical protein VTO42DRAFT_7497 [Malbranchea cinnamomea]